MVALTKSSTMFAESTLGQRQMIGLVVTWNVDILCPVAAIYMSVDSRRTANAVEGIETFDSTGVTRHLTELVVDPYRLSVR